MKNLKKLSVLLLVAVSVVLFGGCSAGSGSSFQNMSNMIEAAFPKVVTIKVFNKSNAPRDQWFTAGSGVIFYATPEFSLVATNAHVVGDKNGLYNYFDIVNWSAELYKGQIDTLSKDGMADYTVRVSKSQILYSNINKDIAIIKYTPPSAFRNCAVNLRKTILRPGEPVAALGYSLGQFHRASVGTVTEIFEEFECEDESGILKNLKYGFMHDATALQGNSGGPVLDVYGNLIGLTTMVAMMKTSDSNVYAPAPGFSIALSARVIDELFCDPANAGWRT